MGLRGLVCGMRVAMPPAEAAVGVGDQALPVKQVVPYNKFISWKRGQVEKAPRPAMQKSIIDYLLG